MERYYEALEGLPEELRDKLFRAFTLLREEIARTVTREDFEELRKVVQELAEAQKRTEEEIRKLSGSLKRTREEVGGLSRSVAYALENEAYRKLPQFLKEHYGIELQERFIRAEVAGKEINIYGRVRKDGKRYILVGEAVLRLDDASKVRKVVETAKLVEREERVEVIPLVVTHFARKRILELAAKKGITVVQSFEW